MVDVSLHTKGSKWVCPNDRQLALRAKLQTGWSVKTYDLQRYGKKEPTLNSTEQDIIKQVIEKAEMLEMKEQERVGRLIDRLDNMKRNVMGNGTNQCKLCGDNFGLFGPSSSLCHDCKKLVCEKCGIETHSSSQETLWLCKICSETREMWKKSGAWFFKGLPKYKLPEKKNDKYTGRRLTRPGLEKNNWSKSNTSLPDSQSRKLDSVEDETSSEDDKKNLFWSRTKTEDKIPQINLSVSNALEKSPKSPSALSNISGSIFFNTSSDSGKGESDVNQDKSTARTSYQRETSVDSSGSTNSSFSRQTSSTFSEHQTNSSNPYLSSINQSYEKLSLNYEKSTLKYDKSPVSPVFDKSPIPFLKKSPINLEKSPTNYDKKTVAFEKLSRKLPTPAHDTEERSPTKLYEHNDKSPTGYDVSPTSSSSSSKSVKTVIRDTPVDRPRKKSSIDFGRAANFLKSPLRGDKNCKKSGKSEKSGGIRSKLSKFSISETSLESQMLVTDSASCQQALQEDRRVSVYSNQSELGANHWLSQESVADSCQTGIYRRESMNSTTSKDTIYWSEDQSSLAGTDITEPSFSFGQNAQLGWIELSLWYDPVRTALHCSLHRAKGLRAMDINGLSDPFCKLNILPVCGKSNRLKTKTVHKTRNPEFNEAVTFYGLTETDIDRKTLHILVLDDDKYGHDILGEAKIPLDRVGAKQTRHVSVFLEKHVPLEEDEEDVWGEETVSHRGQILVTLTYSTKKRALVVGIVRCANLVPMDNNGFSDPFVKLHLRSDPNHKKYKTSVRWKNLNPVFNEEFTFETKMTDLPRHTLVLTVWDKDYGKSNDYLGGLELGWKSKGERLKHWIDMIKFPDHKHEGWHSLGEDLITE